MRLLRTISLKIFPYPLFSVTLLLAAVCLAFTASCKKDTAPPEKEKDTGIHQTVERGPAAVSLDVDKKEITIAERLNLSINITVDEDYEVNLPAFGEKLEQFGIVDYHTSQPVLTENNKKRISRSYVLEPFLSGEYTISPMKIKFFKKGDQEDQAHEIETPEVKVTVKSLLPEDMKEVKLNEIKPPVAVPRSYKVWLWSGAIAVVCIGVAAALIIIMRRRKKDIPTLDAKILPHQLAYEELRRLVAEDLPEKGEIKLFYQHISGIIRRYIENRFGIHAPEQTTEEFLAGLESDRSFPSQHKALLNTFLRHCDLVKFAEYQPQAEDIQMTFDSCKAFIEGTAEGVSHAF
ncbi:conserved exported hypothetical protein [uncultured Desulfobacterium sp.]|uniref:Uncharacterized protein n=1 Tax=uncultured Desulfobacterium sp. TaxID=201089 RepID=A0A445MXJ3_9BACT|nr:conserved exported hypothetical protein [uncultured Desulfobacterium sp.]